MATWSVAVHGPLLPVDFWLLDKWKSDAPESDAEQRADLYRRFVELGYYFRQQYDSAVAERTSNLTAEQVELLSSLRPKKDRLAAQDLLARGKRTRPWLRTNYVDDGCPVPGDPHDAWVVTNEQSGLLIWNDANRFKFGGNWSEILGVFPELVRLLREVCGHVLIKKCRLTLIAKVNSWGTELPETRYGLWEDYFLERLKEDPNCFGIEWEGDPTDSEMEDSLGDMDDILQLQQVFGTLYVQHKTEDADQYLLLWIDQFGRIVRQAELPWQKLESTWIGVGTALESENSWWINAWQGIEYDESGFLELNMANRPEL